MTSADLGRLSRDAFLGGRLTLAQPVRGYRAGVDPVALAAAVPARPGDSVLELGCGAGTAMFCLAARVGGLDLTGVERQGAYADLARANAAANGISASVVTADLTALPPAVTSRRFDHVIANPPYFRGGSPATDAGRDAALRESTPLAAWMDAALRRLAPRGRLTVIQRADRLADLLAAIDARAGGVALHPLAPRPGAPATRVLLTAIQGSRAPLRLMPPVPLREVDGAEAAVVRAVLRDAAPWPGTADPAGT